MVTSVFEIPTTSCPQEAVAGRPSRPRDVIPARPFFAGPENILLQQAVCAATTAWTRYNPLFVSGATGTGKSHLVRCLLAASLQEYPDGRWLLTTGADFVRSVHHAFEVDAMDELRNKHRATDLFILDGLHELHTKPAAQRELLHTVDRLLDANALVIITSRYSLNQSAKLPKALTSRLGIGLTIPLELPRAETRLAILKRLAQEQQIMLPEAICHRLCGPATDGNGQTWTVPDLQSAILKLCHQPDAIDDSCQDLFGPKRHPSATARSIARRVGKYYHLSLAELSGASRRKTVTQARAVAIYLIRTSLGSSFQSIGRLLGNRDHTTVIHAYRRAQELLLTDPATKRAVEELTSG